MISKQRLDIFMGALQRAGLRLTPQRRAVCEYLAHTDQHPSPYQVYADVTRAHPEISRATIYNTLNTLQQLGAIVEVSFGAEHTHYDTNPEPHINLICLRCHSVVDYHSAVADQFTKNAEFVSLQEAIGFQVMATKVDVLGLCHACQQEGQAVADR